MAYRSDLDAMEARVANLDAELADRTSERDEARRMLDEARARARNDAIYADYAAGGPARRFRRNCWIAGAVLIALVAGMFTYRVMTRDTRMDRAMATFEELTEMMCACKDKTCATAVADRMTKWGSEASKEWGDARPTQGEMKQMEVISGRLTKCMMQTMTVENP